MIAMVIAYSEATLIQVLLHIMTILVIFASIGMTIVVLVLLIKLCIRAIKALDSKKHHER